MNITTVRESVKEFIATRIPIYEWDLDKPSKLTVPIGLTHYPANTAIELPAQNIYYQKEGVNTITTSLILPYVITYRFPNSLTYHELPTKGLENVLSTIQMLGILQKPHPDITIFEAVEIEDSITDERATDTSGDWLVKLNFAFRAEFRTTEFPDISDIYPADYYDIANPPNIQQTTIRVNRANSKFKPEDSSTYTEDTTLILNN